jgi:hypothetical protein
MMRKYIAPRDVYSHMPNFLCYVITYSKDEHSRWKLIRNLRQIVDVNRCINLYIGN